MEKLLETRCSKGKLIVYSDKVSIERNLLGSHTSNSLFLNQISGVEVKTSFPSIFGIGGIGKVIIHGTGNQKLEAGTVKLDSARRVGEIINQLLFSRK